MIWLLLACGGSPTQPAPALGGHLPRHPLDIPVEPLQYTPPQRSAFRGAHDGVPVYVAEGHELPVVHLSLTFKGGTYLEPDGHAGLARLMGQVMRSGGTTSLEPRALDDALDQIAAKVEIEVGSERSVVRATCLKSTFDACAHHTFELVRSPRFDPNRFRLAVDGWRAELARRDDDASMLLNRAWGRLLWGEDSYLGQDPDEDDLAAVELADLRALHERIFHPGNLWVTAAGDVDRAQIDALLDRELAGWARGEAVSDPPAPGDPAAPGVYHLQKQIPQGKIRFGMRGLKRDHPDQLAVEVMNFILGGGGFVSRITARVRTDEGLAYSVGSRFDPRLYFPGEVRFWTESKSETVALATKIMWEEVQRIQDEPVSAKELETAKASLFARFPRRFESRDAMLAAFVDQEISGQSEDHWSDWQARLEAITAQDVQRVAKEHLDVGSMILVVVGDWEPIQKGDGKGRASMKDFYEGAVTHLEL